MLVPFCVLTSSGVQSCSRCPLGSSIVIIFWVYLCPGNGILGFNSGRTTILAYLQLILAWVTGTTHLPHCFGCLFLHHLHLWKDSHKCFELPWSIHLPVKWLYCLSMMSRWYAVWTLGGKIISGYFCRVAHCCSMMKCGLHSWSWFLVEFWSLRECLCSGHGQPVGSGLLLAGLKRFLLGRKNGSPGLIGTSRKYYLLWTPVVVPTVEAPVRWWHRFRVCRLAVIRWFDTAVSVLARPRHIPVHILACQYRSWVWGGGIISLNHCVV